MTPAAALHQKAIDMFEPGLKLAVITDSESYADAVLVAIARPAAACVMRIARSEYDGIKLAELAGWTFPQPKEPHAHITLPPSPPPRRVRGHPNHQPGARRN